MTPRQLWLTRKRFLLRLERGWPLYWPSESDAIADDMRAGVEACLGVVLLPDRPTQEHPGRLSRAAVAGLLG